jgi:type II secretory pathway component GspD/PulD (secretin)
MSTRISSRLSRSLFACAVAGIALSALAAPRPAHADGDTLDRRVDVALAESAPAEAFDGLAKMVGLDAAVDPGLDGKVTVRLENVRMRTVLDAVCESIGCRWDVTAGSPAKLHIQPLPEGPARKKTALKEPIDLKVKEANVLEVLQVFGQMLSADVEIDPRLAGGKVTFELDNIPCGQALDKVCASAGCTWKLETDGQKPVLRITKK